MSLVRACFLGMLLCWGSGVLAGPARAAQADGLADLMQAALQWNPSLRVASSDLLAAEEELAAARWGRFPTVSANSELLDDGERQGTLRVEQPLWSGGRISGEIERASAGTTEAVAARGLAQLELLEAVGSAYFEGLRLQQRVAVASDNVAEHERLLAVIERRAAAQVNPQADRLLARARLEQARADLLLFQRQLDLVLGQLQQQVGRPVSRLAPVPEQTLMHSFESLAGLQAQALGFSPALQRAQAIAAQRTAQLQLSRASYLPEVVVGHQQRLWLSNQPGVDSGTRSYVGVQLQVSNGLSGLATTRAADARQAAARDQLALEREALKEVLQRHWIEATTLERQLPVVAEVAAASADLIESYLRQFQVGNKSWLDVLNSQREKAQAEYLLADTAAPLQLARLRLLLLSGTLNASTLDLLHE